MSELGSLFEPYVWAWFRDTFSHPSPAQSQSWPKIARGLNTLIFSPTGSGKTLAAFLWAINDLFRMGRQGALDDEVYVLYVSPLKALDNDIQKNLVQPLRGIREYARKAGIDLPPVRSAVRTGDTTQRQRARMARRPPHIFITTPESLFIILSTAKFRLAFRNVKYVIVDEIHAISDNKRGVHLSLSLERLRHLAGGDFVRIGLSATQKPLAEIARFLVGLADGRPRPCEIVDVGGRKELNVQVISPVDDLLEAQYDAIWGSSYAKLISLIRGHKTTLIFANSRYATERTALRLGELALGDDMAVGAHHGSMSRKVRLDMEERLKRGKLDALVATSSLELGIDVGSIDLVCQLQSPKSVSAGMQRIGRAGHLLDATSKGRLLVTDRDDLVESAVLTKAILDGEIDRTHVPTSCLDVLAQHIVGAVAADPWHADELYKLCRQSHCYRDLRREDYDRVLEMISGYHELDMERPPYPKIIWDRVNNMLYPERGARLIAFRSSGTIPDVEDYDVYFQERKTKVGQLDEGFVERLHTGDIFVLGTSSWRVLGFRRNRVLVEDVYGRAPTIPFWGGDRASRTYDLGLLVGRFRRKMEEQLEHGTPIEWLQREYCVDRDGAYGIREYIREQRLVAGVLPSDRLVLIEYVHDELGQLQTIIHSCFGVRVNEPWAMVLSQAIQDRYGFRPQTATVDDGILITLPMAATNPFSTAFTPLELVNPQNLDQLLRASLYESPVYLSRFRHNAVRSLMVLREYRGRRTPVWLQSVRASALLEACRQDRDFPLMAETYRECTTEALDVPNLRAVLEDLASGEIEVRTVETKIPSPFSHSLLLLGQYGDIGAAPTQERRSRLMHLHREVLRQILDRETLRNLLDESAVVQLEARLQGRTPDRKARNANELGRMLVDLGDLVTGPDEELSLLDRADGDANQMLQELAATRRAVQVPIPTAETYRERWIATQNLSLYRAAFAHPVELDDVDRQILQFLQAGQLRSAQEIPVQGDVEGHLGKLVGSYHVLRIPLNGRVDYVATEAWLPPHILRQRMSRKEARFALIGKLLRWHGPLNKYEIMERYGLPSAVVEEALDALYEDGTIVTGEYVPTKAAPQWCYRSNLEQIHRMTLARLRKEIEPAPPEAYADFLARWQHVHPQTKLSGLDGLRQVIDSLQGQENYQILYERDMFSARLSDYDPPMLDRLCYSGEVVWRRIDYTKLRRGQIGFCMRRDHGWLLSDPGQVDMRLDRWDEDIPDACSAVRDYLREAGACFFDDIVKGTGLDWRLVLRAVWHLVWTGEATNDSYESIRHARISSGLSACYDLATRPGRKGVTLDLIVRHMLENRKLDPRLGRWTPTERLVPPSRTGQDAERVAQEWAQLLLRRYGIVCREFLRREVGAPPWRDLRRALVRLELLGQVQQGFFLQELSGEQYADPEALAELRAAKLRQPDMDGAENAELEAAPTADPEEPMILLNVCDPANPFGTLFPTTNQAGEEVKFMLVPTKYLVLQGGQPLLLYEERIQVLIDLSQDRAEKALRTLMQLVDRPPRVAAHDAIRIRDWNGHPIDISPERHLLLRLGFCPADSRQKGFIYDGLHKPDPVAVTKAEAQVPSVCEHVGKAKAPVKYDAEWIVSRSDEMIRLKVRELIQWLQRVLPSECELVYRPRQFTVRYRGMRCMTPHIQKRQIRLHITHKGWHTGVLIGPDTDLTAPEFPAQVLNRFEEVRREIDALLDTRVNSASIL